MKTEEWLQRSSKKLEQAGIGTARLDCLVLLEDATGLERSKLLAHPESELTKGQLEPLDKQLKRRTTHEPLAYIRNKTEFYGRKFYVDKRVLEPRPESETMIEILKNLDLPAKASIVDVGTGSGALGITAALELHTPNVELIDTDPLCLEVADINMKRYDLHLKIRENSLLSRVKGSFHVILANLPYVPDTYHINEAALQEPHIAIFGGEDGLELYRELFEQLQMNQALYVLTESLPFQHAALAKIAKGSGYKQVKEDDFIQLFTSH